MGRGSLGYTQICKDFHLKIISFEKGNGRWKMLPASQVQIDFYFFLDGIICLGLKFSNGNDNTVTQEQSNEQIKAHDLHAVQIGQQDLIKGI